MTRITDIYLKKISDSVSYTPESFEFFARMYCQPLEAMSYLGDILSSGYKIYKNERWADIWILTAKNQKYFVATCHHFDNKRTPEPQDKLSEKIN